MCYDHFDGGSWLVVMDLTVLWKIKVGKVIEEGSKKMECRRRYGFSVHGDKFLKRKQRE